MSHNTNRRPGMKTGTAARGWAAAANGTPPVEPSAWMRGVHARIAARAEVQGMLARELLVLVPIWPGSAFIATDVEDRTCDRCRTYVAMGVIPFAYRAAKLPGLTIAGGLCADCARREGVVA